MKKILLMIAALLSGAGPAVSQDAASALKGHNSRAPIDFTADRIELQDRADRAIFSGNVQVTQASLRLATARLTVAYSRAGSTDVERLDAAGGVTLTSPSETARSDYAIYDVERRMITMLGDVRLDRGGSEVRGGRLLLTLDDGRAVIDGSAVGEAAPGTAAGRVSGRFTVPQDRQ
jgi:lipopolysaccharide export system protein LptA